MSDEITTSHIRYIDGQYVVVANEMVIAIEDTRHEAESQLYAAKHRPWRETVALVEMIRGAQQAEGRKPNDRLTGSD